MANIDKGAITKVNTAHGFSNSFLEACGVRQGALLSPTKFCAWADALLTWLHRYPPDGVDDITVPGGKQGIFHVLHAIFYADDMFLVASTHQRLQAKVDMASKFLQHFGVHVNAKKSL